jgi:isoquinoline 1-oxidoreductase beta subunit
LGGLTLETAESCIARDRRRRFSFVVHESFESVVAYVVEASVKDGQPSLHRVTAGVHCNLTVNPRSVEAQL